MIVMMVVWQLNGDGDEGRMHNFNCLCVPCLLCLGGKGWNGGFFMESK